MTDDNKMLIWTKCEIVDLDHLFAFEKIVFKNYQIGLTTFTKKENWSVLEDLALFTVECRS